MQFLKRAGFGPSAPAFKAPRIEPGFEAPYAFTEPYQVQRPAMERGPTAAVGSAITGCLRLTSKKSSAKSTLLWMGKRSAAHQGAHQVHRTEASLTMVATRRSTSGMWPIHLPQRVGKFPMDRRLRRSHPLMERSQVSSTNWFVDAA
jgi:hypothetical protein